MTRKMRETGNRIALGGKFVVDIESIIKEVERVDKEESEEKTKERV